MKMGCRIIGLFVIIAALAMAGIGVYAFTHRGDLVEQAVVNAGGSKEVGKVAHKVMEGENLSDTEIRESLGIDKKTYKLVKKSAKDLGIDLNDSSQLREIGLQNAGNIQELQNIAEQVQSGKLTSEKQVKERLRKTLNLPDSSK